MVDSALALDVEDLSVALGDRQILTCVGFSVCAGESLAIVGRSGSGKSTLLNCILGLMRPDSGQIRVGGTDMVAASSPVAARLRREQIGMVFQSGELLHELSPVENVMVSAMLAGRRTAEARAAAVELLHDLGIESMERSVSQFSGGERQRVAVARALVNRPSLLLADEPTGSLDPGTRDMVSDLLFDLPAQFGCALAVVTHDPAVASRADQRLDLPDHRSADGSAGS